jgi:quinohemoprotein ethanol dehydrogenase
MAKMIVDRCALVLMSIALTPLLFAEAAFPMQAGQSPAAQYLDASDGQDWPGYGRTFGQQHYSPLSQINETNVSRLGLVWSLDLGLENSVREPIAVDGVLYFATGLTIVQAVDASSGRLLWRYDPKSAERAGLNLRLAWGVRGIAWWNGKVYVGTADGRLIALDARNGTPIWSVETFDKNFPARINGAPRVYDGKVIIGYAGTTGKTRGFVTTYDAETGKRLWRFYAVPGNPVDGFENKAMAMASKTWSGQWWKFGGGGDVWNAIAYDPETDTIYIGTGSGYPWNRRARSADHGDNLFVASIVGLDGKSGAYKWHYQVTPGDTWDYDATMDIELADLEISGKTRKVLMQAPKNGFFYVLDRITGQLISAEPYAKVTWASRIDLKTGRPVETPGARYPNGTTADIWPCAIGAHSWMPMAYSPKTLLAYIPAIKCGNPWSDKNVDIKAWRPPTDRVVAGAVDGDSAAVDESVSSDSAADIDGALVAWDPVAQKAMWTLPRPTHVNGGVLATGGDVIFQGTIDGSFNAYSARAGKLLWSFDARTPLLATPISYAVSGKQYVTLLTGLGMGMAAEAGMLGERLERYGVDPRSQARRVLTFALDGNITLPPSATPAPVPQDPDFKADPTSANAGGALYGRHCLDCHGDSVIGTIHAPDLRRSAIPLSVSAFASIVRDGALVAHGMPNFPELNETQLRDLRQYIRTQAEKLRQHVTSGR